MGTEHFIIIVVLLAAAVLLGGVSIVVTMRKGRETRADIACLENELYRGDTFSELRREIASSTQDSMRNMGEMITQNQLSFAIGQSESLNRVEERIKTFSVENEQKLENIRTTVESSLAGIRRDNAIQLEEMRRTVDEKLQTTLEEKMNQSFSLVSRRLEQVYKGLGEMQAVAAGVGDLKKILSNVKTRGILGEIQLGSIIREILAPEQYEENIATKAGSRDVVEFAVKLPATDDGFIYLPIDAKFPGDSYAALRDAYDLGDKDAVERAARQLTNTIRAEARDISSKYIDPPNTTEFAVMFLPFEGLYSEVVNRGMVEVLQRDYKVNIAGPSTMAALLNSMQMGFRTLAVQKRSAEVWDLLRSVKTEFDKFGETIAAVQHRINQANNELDNLVGARTRQIQRKLRAVQEDRSSSESLPEDIY